MIYKVNYKINGQYGSYVFNYKTEEEKDGKLKEWKQEFATPYNKIEILWYGTLDKWEEEQRPLEKFIRKPKPKKRWKIYANLMRFVKNPLNRLR